MSGLGTDVMALACILGGAAVGGVVTAAASDGSAHAVEEVHAVCATEAPHAGPRMIVVAGGDERVVVAPRVRVRDAEGCAVVVDPRVEIRVRGEIDERVQERMDRARERMERARERMERAQERVERARDRAGRLQGADLDRAREEIKARLSDLENAERALEGVNISIDGMNLQLEELNLDELGEDLQLRIQSRIDGRLDVEMKQLQEKLDRIGRDIGR